MSGDGAFDDFGRFRLLERIGAGGMGEVFRAEMHGPDGFQRIVVVKRMLPDLAAEPQAVAMFVDEARLAARLVHPNIVQVYDFGKVGTRYFLVMEYVAGCDLSRLLVHLADQKRTISVAVSLTIAAALLEGLAFAHDLRGSDGELLGLVHRDVAPSNVLLGTSGEIKLTDFGIAKTREQLEHTRAGVIKGKPHYMSPEQASGRPLDARSDLFSVGVVLFKLLTGHRPFRGVTGEEVLGNIRRGDYDAPETLNPEISPRMSALLAHALRPLAEDRFQSARELRQALLAEAARDGVVPDPEALRSMVTEAANAFAKQDAIPTQPGRRTPPRERTEPMTVEGAGDDGVVAPAVTPGRSRAPSSSRLLPEPPEPRSAIVSDPRIVSSNPASLTGVSATAVNTLVIQSRHVIYGAIAIVVLLAAALLSALWLRGGGERACTLRVALRMYPAQQQWFETQVFGPFAKAQGCKIEVVEFNSTEELGRMLANGEADVAKVDVEHAPVLVELGRLQRLTALGERVDARGFGELRKALRPEALRLGTLRTTTGEDLYLVPRKLETAQLVYRRSLVEVAVRELPKHQPALDARLRELLGHGLPDGFTLNPDPAKWTSWDLVAASWAWAHAPIRGRTEPRYALRAEKRVLMEAIAAGAPAHDPWHVSPALVALFYQYAVLRELDVLHPDTYQTIEYAKVRELLASGGLAAFIEVQIDVGILVGNGRGLAQQIDDPGDWDVAPLPRLADLQQANAAPLVADSLSEICGWGWGVPRNARDPEMAMRLILNIVSRDRHAAELEEFPILRVRDDVSPSWPVSRRVNEVGDQQLANSRARYVQWPKRAGEIEQIEQRIERAFRDIVIERNYRGESAAIDRATIEARLHKFLDAD